MTLNVSSVRERIHGAAPDHILSLSAGPPLPPGFTAAGNKHPFFRKNWKWKVPLCAREPIEMFPGVTTFDPEFLKFLTLCVQKGPEVFKVDLDDQGFVGSNGVHKDVSTFGTVSGFRQAPVAYSMRDNGLLRESLGLPNEWRRERDRLIYREWLDLFFSEWNDRTLRVAAKSKSGPIHMTFQPNEKVQLVEERMVMPRLNKILGMIKKKDYRGLRKDHQCVGLGVTGRRGQSDAASKVREVATELYAQTGGREGLMVKTDKHVNIHDINYDDLSAQRVRLVIGYSVIMNTIGQLMSSGHQHAAYERFPKVLKFAAVQDALDDLSANFLPDEPVLDAFFADVTNFDATAVPEFRFKEILASMGSFWDEGMVSLQEMLHRAPYCSAPLSLDGEFFWSGNPDDPESYNSTGGLKSGHNMVSIIGILEMVGEFLIVSDYAFGNVLGNVKRILEGDYMLRLWDKGDDHGVWGSPDAVARYEQYATARDDKNRTKYAYFKVEPEPGKQFIGSIIMRLGPRQFKALPRIHGIFDKTFCNEHSVNSNFRPCWPIGNFARKELYGASPAYDVYNMFVDEQWAASGAQRKFGSLTSIIDRGMDECQSLWRLAHTAIDLDVLLTPSKIDYRYADDAITPEIIKLFKKDINHDITYKAATTLYGGVINERKY